MITSSPQGDDLLAAEFAGRLLSHPALPYYQELLGRLQCLVGRTSEPLRTVGVTSCSPGEGVSTVAANLAVAAAAASAGHSVNRKPVLLIDSNFPRPMVGKSFRLESGATAGLADVLLGKCEPAEAAHATAVPNLSIMPAGESAELTSAIADRASVAELLAWIKDRYSLVIVDLPPPKSAGIALPMAASLDGVLLVLEANRSLSNAAEKVKRELEQVQARILGAVLNKERPQRSWWGRKKESDN